MAELINPFPDEGPSARAIALGHSGFAGGDGLLGGLEVWLGFQNVLKASMPSPSVW